MLAARWVSWLWGLGRVPLCSGCSSGSPLPPQLRVFVPPHALKLPEEPITRWGEYWCDVTVSWSPLCPPHHVPSSAPQPCAPFGPLSIPQPLPMPALPPKSKEPGASGVRKRMTVLRTLQNQRNSPKPVKTPQSPHPIWADTLCIVPFVCHPSWPPQGVESALNYPSGSKSRSSLPSARVQLPASLLGVGKGEDNLVPIRFLLASIPFQSCSFPVLPSRFPTTGPHCGFGMELPWSHGRGEGIAAGSGGHSRCSPLPAVSVP